MLNYLNSIALALFLSFFFTHTYSQSISSQQAESAHNNVRHNVNNGSYSNQPIAQPLLLDLVWEQDLADSSQLYANQCVWQHSSNRINMGENLYVQAFSQPGQVTTIEQAVNSWAEEYLDYNFSDQTCESNKMCGHYTQIVWQDTLQVGCAAAQCNPIMTADGNSLFSSDFPYSTYIVCQYGPAGNINGLAPYETQGSNNNLLSNYDISTETLQVPYLLLHKADSNLVEAYQASLQLFSTNPITLQLIQAPRTEYQGFSYSDSYDQNTQQLFLSNMLLFNQGVLQSTHAAVLKYVPGSSNLFELKSIK